MHLCLRGQAVALVRAALLRLAPLQLAGCKGNKAAAGGRWSRTDKILRMQLLVRSGPQCRNRPHPPTIQIAAASTGQLAGAAVPRMQVPVAASQRGHAPKPSTAAHLPSATPPPRCAGACRAAAAPPSRRPPAAGRVVERSAGWQLAVRSLRRQRLRCEAPATTGSGCSLRVWRTTGTASACLNDGLSCRPRLRPARLGRHVPVHQLRNLAFLGVQAVGGGRLWGRGQGVPSETLEPARLRMRTCTLPALGATCLAAEHAAPAAAVPRLLPPALPPPCCPWESRGRAAPPPPCAPARELPLLAPCEQCFQGPSGQEAGQGRAGQAAWESLAGRGTRQQPVGRSGSGVAFLVICRRACCHGIQECTASGWAGAADL